MAAQIVHHDDVAWAKFGEEDLADIGAERFAIDWPVEDAGRGEAGGAQGGDEGERTPTPMGRMSEETARTRPPPSQWSHIGLHPSFINEHKTVRIKAALQSAPPPAFASDIWTGLFVSEQRFFYGSVLQP